MDWPKMNMDDSFVKKHLHIGGIKLQKWFYFIFGPLVCVMIMNIQTFLNMFYCLSYRGYLCYVQTILDCWYVGGGRPGLLTTKGPGLTVEQRWSRGPPNW